MTFSVAYLSQLAVGRANKVWFYDAAAAGADTPATVKAAGYFNNTDDAIIMAVGDVIHVYTDTGSFDLTVESISSGAVTTKAKGGVVPVENAAAGVAFDNEGLTIIGGDTVSDSAFTLGDPIVGETKTIVQVDTTTTGVVVTTASTGVSLSVAGARTATFNGANDALTLIGLSTTRWGIIGNVGSVSIA